MELLFYIFLTIALVIVSSIVLYWIFEVILKAIEENKKKKRSAEDEIVCGIIKERIKYEIWTKALKIVVQEYYDKNGLKAIEPTFEMLEESFWLTVTEMKNGEESNEKETIQTRKEKSV